MVFILLPIGFSIFYVTVLTAFIEKHNFVLTPGQYVGIPDDVSFEEWMRGLVGASAVQMREAKALDLEIKVQLAKVGFKINDICCRDY